MEPNRGAVIECRQEVKQQQQQQQQQTVHSTFEHINLSIKCVKAFKQRTGHSSLIIERGMRVLIIKCDTKVSAYNVTRGRA